MADQAKMSNGNSAPPAAVQPVMRKVGDLAHDVLTLVELQAQLFAVDVTQCSRRLRLFGMLLLGSVVLAWACFPVLLATLALGLVEAFGLTPATAFFLAVLVGLVLSVVLGTFSWYQIRKATSVLNRSGEELKRNLRWVKGVLKRGGSRGGRSILPGRNMQ